MMIEGKPIIDIPRVHAVTANIDFEGKEAPFAIMSIPARRSWLSCRLRATRGAFCCLLRFVLQPQLLWFCLGKCWESVNVGA
jgi:hypothetical protein